LLVAGAAGTPAQCAAQAGAAIDSGAAVELLSRLAKHSHGAT
jgi:hypothetical protein